MSSKIAVAGLSRLAARIMVSAGALVAAKGLYDAFLGAPEANFYSSEPWQFVTREQWLRWSGFELLHGLSCAALGRAAWAYARRLPEFRRREIVDGVV